MLETLSIPFPRFHLNIGAWSDRLRQTRQRLRRAFDYAAGRLDAAGARQLILDCRAPAGWRPLLLLTVDGALDEAHETFASHPDLPRLIADACAELEYQSTRRWREIDYAHQRVLEIAEAYAREEGIALTRWDDIVPTPPPPRIEQDRSFSHRNSFSAYIAKPLI